MDKKIFLLCTFAAFSLISRAQNYNGSRPSNFPKLNLPVELSPKGGITMPSQTLAGASFMDKGWMAGLDASLPIFKLKNKANTLSFDLGLDAGADYSSLTANSALAYVRGAYKLSNGNLNPYFDNSTNQARIIQAAIGPRVAFRYKKLHITPAIQFGYMNFQRNGYSILDTVRNAAGDQSTIPLMFAKEVNASGLLIRPKINIGFDINKYLRLGVGSAISTGPAINSDYFLWQPKGQNKNTPTKDDLIEGNASLHRVSASFKLMSFDVGLKMGLGFRQLSKPDVKMPKKASDIQKSVYKDKVAGVAGKVKAEDINSLAAPVPENSKEQAAQATYNATAPEIVYPANNSKASLIGNDLYLTYKASNTENVQYELSIWKEENGKRINIIKETYASDWNGMIKDFGNYVNKEKAEQFHAQIKAIPGNNIAQPKLNKSKSDYYTVAQPNGQPIFDNNGFGLPITFSVGSACFPNMSLSVDSAKCIDSGKAKVWGHVTLTNVTGVTVTSITITDFKENNFSGPTVPVSNLIPGTSLPVVNNSSFSFKVDKDMCNKVLFVRVAITYTCLLTGESITVPCADTLTMPCCKCNYCEDSMKITSQNSGIVYNSANNQAQISQTFNVVPNNITSVTAEIVYMSDSVNDSICRICDTKPADLYHFTGTNTISWNGNAAINATSGNSSQSFPTKIIKWQCNNNGNVRFNLNVGLPDIPDLECCKAYTRICIRYSFIDVNCKKCEVLICYSLNYNAASGKKGNTNTKN